MIAVVYAFLFLNLIAFVNISEVVTHSYPQYCDSQIIEQPDLFEFYENNFLYRDWPCIDNTLWTCVGIGYYKFRKNCLLMLENSKIASIMLQMI